MTRHVEGITSLQVPDSTKIVCPRCNSSLWYISSVLDDPIDLVKQDPVFAALMIVAAGAHFCGLVALCHNCGQEFSPIWYIFDVGASDGAAITMTHLDTNRNPGTGANATADLLEGLFMIFCGDDVNDTGEYFTIITNTAASPAVITPTVAPNAGSDGLYMITNLLPVGMTAAA